MEHEFSRTELLIGKEKLDRLKNSVVMVLGMGGVGSHCTEALARSGVGKLILVDNDRVSLTNINRQSIAYHSTLGEYKTEVMRRRIRDICPQIEVKVYNMFVLPENIHRLFEETVDYVIDAVDTVAAKLALAETTREKGIPIISSMGTGNKLHGERFEIADISETSVCPLCRVMRRELRARGIFHLKVLYSKEKPVRAAAFEAGEYSKDRPAPGSVSFVPPVAGLLLAGEAIRDLAEI